MSSPVIKYYKTKLKNVYLIKPPTIFKDMRGMYVETYNKKLFSRITRLNFIQDDISVSKKNVLRGIHGDKKTWKLISCILGKFYLVVVNNDIKSKQYKKWICILMDSKNPMQVLVPPKFGNGHYVVSKIAIFGYKQTTYYNRSGQFTIKWNDPNFKIKWPLKKKPITSKRDS